MKKIKIFTLILVVAFATLFGYANLRHLSLIETLKPVALTSMKIDGHLTSQEQIELEKKISALAGVTACTISKDGDVASIIFYPDQMTEKKVAQMLSNDGSLKISEINLEKSGGCPVHELNSSFLQLISLLDLRQ